MKKFLFVAAFTLALLGSYSATFGQAYYHNHSNVPTGKGDSTRTPGYGIKQRGNIFYLDSTITKYSAGYGLTKASNTIFIDSTATTRFGAVKIGTVGVYSGAGSPNGSVTAPVGSIYLRTNGVADSTLYIKESGTGNTGWKFK